jgi:DNA-binding CsgD family transcriptional regulator
MASHLTSRERECLMMLVEGLDTAAMVDLLGVSRTTVRTHLQSVLTKLGVHSRLEAASFAVRHRLPDLWSGDISAATVGAVRPNAVRTPSLLQATSTVRPIRPRRVAVMRERATQQDLPVAAGQGVSAG